MSSQFIEYWEQKANSEEVRIKFRSLLMTMEKIDLIKMIESGTNTDNMRIQIIEWGEN